jgi:hypothetical protein
MSAGKAVERIAWGVFGAAYLGFVFRCPFRVTVVRFTNLDPYAPAIEQEVVFRPVWQPAAVSVETGGASVTVHAGGIVALIGTLALANLATLRLMRKQAIKLDWSSRGPAGPHPEPPES